MMSAPSPRPSRSTRKARCSGTCGSAPGLAPRDRGIVTLAALIARNQTIELDHYLSLALDNGVKPREISEIITHLAFYSGWNNAMAAVAVAKEVFASTGPSGSTNSRPPRPRPLPARRGRRGAARGAGGEQFGAVAPGVVQYTTDVLFRDLWLRPDLAPRDRSLVTVSALIASGQVAQVPYHLNRAMDNGLTREQAAEVHHAPGILRRLAQRHVGAAGCEGGVRKAPPLGATRRRPPLRGDWDTRRRGPA